MPLGDPEDGRNDLRNAGCMTAKICCEEHQVGLSACTATLQKLSNIMTP